MKLGDVIRKEREGRGLNRSRKYTIEEAAKALGVSTAELEQIEAGNPSVEKWFPILCQLAVKLNVPTSRLLAKSGKGKDTKHGQSGVLIREHRERAGISAGDLAKRIDMAPADYMLIEKGESPIESVGPLMLRFAEMIEQPVFNLYMPCGVLFEELKDYP